MLFISISMYIFQRHLLIFSKVIEYLVILKFTVFNHFIESFSNCIYRRRLVYKMDKIYKKTKQTWNSLRIKEVKYI